MVALEAIEAREGQRLAVLGGDGRIAGRLPAGNRFRVFRGRRYGGNGELRRLEAALRSGSIDRLIILARWNGHSSTTRALRLCRRYGVSWQLIP